MSSNYYLSVIDSHKINLFDFGNYFIFLEMEDEDDESVSSMTMEDISMEEETPDFSDTSFSPELHEDLKPYIIKLTNELHKGVTDPNDCNLEGVFRALLNLICPVAFKVIKGDEDGKLDIPVDLEIMSALEFELVSILMESSSPYDQIEEFIKLQEPSQVCGKIFAPYEFTYSCRDCGVDNTCVMCNDCFSKSIHQNHNYRMSQSSGGGGCCDCGDPEAWKDGYVCTDHAPNKEKPAREKTPRELQLQKRAEILFLALVRFIFELVIPDVQMFSFSEDSDSEMVKYYNSSSYLEPENKHIASTYALMLYNDEVHTYDDVEKMLKNSVNATTEQAKGYATVVDRIGRTILKQVSYEEARRIQDIVIKETEGNTLYQRQRLGLHNGGPIKSLIIDRRILGLQEVAVRLLKKINSLTCKLGNDHTSS